MIVSFHRLYDSVILAQLTTRKIILGKSFYRAENNTSFDRSTQRFFLLVQDKKIHTVLIFLSFFRSKNFWLTQASLQLLLLQLLLPVELLRRKRKLRRKRQKNLMTIWALVFSIRKSISEIKVIYRNGLIMFLSLTV